MEMSLNFDSDSIDEQINHLENRRNNSFRESSRVISTDSHDEAILDDRFAPGTITGSATPGSTRKNKTSNLSRLQESHSVASNLSRQGNQITSPVSDNGYHIVPNQSSSSFLENYGTTSFDLDSNYAVKITGQHENFHTIDWLRELSRSRQRHRQIKQGTYTTLGENSDNAETFPIPNPTPGFNLCKNLCNFTFTSNFPFISLSYPLSSTSRKKISSILDASSGWLCVLLIGIASGFCAGVVNIVSESMSDFKTGICTQGGIYLNKEACCWSSEHESENCTEFKSWGNLIFNVDKDSGFDHFVTFIFYNLCGVLFAITAAAMVKYFAPYACGSGIPEVKTILSGFVIHGFMGKWTLLIKNLALPLVVGAGMCLGKEGPMVHIASCCGNFFAKKFKKYRNEAKRREILSAACAAGVSVAFGAPIGGVLFSLEEASYYFPLKTLWRSFLCAMVAALTFVTFNPYGSGSLVMFPVEQSVPWSVYEVVPFAILGLVGGLYGALFNKLNMYWCTLRKHAKFGKYPIVEVAMLGLITCALSYPNKYARMSMPSLIRTLFSSWQGLGE